MIHAPFNDDQVNSLNEYQADGFMHPFTCGNNSNHGVLVATRIGWYCTDCDYTQNWAHGFMADWSWNGLEYLDIRF